MASLIIDSGDHKGRHYGLTARPLVGGRALAEDPGGVEFVFQADDDPQRTDAVHEYRKHSPTLRDRGTVRG